MKNPFPPTAHTFEHLLGSDPAIVRGYAQGVSKSLERGPLNLMDRDRIIQRGVRLGLKRFDANLIVAAMEHRMREQGALSPMRLYIDVPESSSPTSSKWLPWATAIAIQGLIVTGAWWLIFA